MNSGATEEEKDANGRGKLGLLTLALALHSRLASSCPVGRLLAALLSS